ncbi:MAG: glycosyltransferase family 4 protein [Acidimicrobiales bacterium]
MTAYAIVFGVAAAGTYLLTFLVRRAATAASIVVVPDERRVHKYPTPTIGGAAMFLAFLAAMAVASRLPGLRAVFQGSSEPLGVVLAAAVIFVVGMVDDLREVSPPAKLAGQVLAASVLYFLGVTMFYARIPFYGIVLLSASLTPLITALWVAGMANAVNLVDGLDGLAAGIVGIGASAFFVYDLQLSKVGLLSPGNIGPLIAIIAAGICIGFLPHNFHPAKIFMGDAGAMLLGLLMAASTMVVGGRVTEPFTGETYFFFAPLFIPFFILGVPMVDMAFAIARRALRHRNISAPDKDHLHHRLLRLGHGHRRAVLILWAWTAMLSGFVLYPTFAKRGTILVPFLMAALGVGLYTMFHRRSGEPGAEAAGDMAGPAGMPAEVPLTQGPAADAAHVPRSRGRRGRHWAAPPRGARPGTQQPPAEQAPLSGQQRRGP